MREKDVIASVGLQQSRLSTRVSALHASGAPGLSQGTGRLATLRSETNLLPRKAPFALHRYLRCPALPA